MANANLISDLSAQGVLTLTMNRPDVHNSFDESQTRSLIEALEKSASDSQVRILVLASNGKSFSAGGDINYMKAMGDNSYDDNIEDAGRLAHLMKTLSNHPKPTIARVQGAAIGGGLGLVCCCDFAIGSERALFAASEVKLGMVAATISPYIINTVGAKNARRLMISAQPVDANRAMQLGILSQRVDASELDSSVSELCSLLLKNAADAMTFSKQIVDKIASDTGSAESIQATIELIANVRDSDEGREGLAAFLEKRKPNWTKPD